MDKSNSEKQNEKNNEKNVGLWEEVVDSEGNSSIKFHETKKISIGCEENTHFYVFLGGVKREAICNKCGASTQYILGYHSIENGVIKIKKV